MPGVSNLATKCDVTRRQRHIRALVSFTLQRIVRANMRRARLMGYSPRSLFRLTGWFHIHVFYSSENQPMGSRESSTVLPSRETETYTSKFMMRTT